MDLKNYAAVENVDGKPLGYLTWYTVSEIEITRDDLEDKLRNSGFESYMPRPISPSDAFRRATSECQRKNVETSQTGLYFNYLIREVYSDTKEIIRHLVIEARDKKSKKLYYEPDTAIIRYDKKGDRVDYQAFSQMADNLVQEALTLFNKHRITYTPRHIRDIVSTILSSMAPVPVRPSGGVYFVPQKYEDTLGSFVALVGQLGGSEAFRVPLIDIAENKDMVRQKLNDYINDTIKHSASVLKDNRFDKSLANIKLKEIKKVMSDYEMYQETLQLSMEDMNSSLGLLRQQARAILDKITSET